MRRRVSRATGTVIALCAVVLAGVGTAEANVTIGSSLTAVGDGYGADCGSITGDCMLGFSHGPTSALLPSPVTGTIVRWGVRVDPGAPSLQLRTFLPGIAGPTIHSSGNPVLSPPGGLDEFAASIPITSGDEIGVEDPGPGFVLTQSGTTTWRYRSYLPTGGGGGTSESLGQLLVNAEIVPSNDFSLSGINKPITASIKPTRNGLPIILTIPNPGSWSFTSRRSRHRKPLIRSFSGAARTHSGDVQLNLTLSKFARRYLADHHHVKGDLTVTYTPGYGTASTKSVVLSVQGNGR